MLKARILRLRSAFARISSESARLRISEVAPPPCAAIQPHGREACHDGGRETELQMMTARHFSVDLRRLARAPRPARDLRRAEHIREPRASNWALARLSLLRARVDLRRAAQLSHAAAIVPRRRRRLRAGGRKAAGRSRQCGPPFIFRPATRPRSLARTLHPGELQHVCDTDQARGFGLSAFRGAKPSAGNSRAPGRCATGNARQLQYRRIDLPRPAYRSTTMASPCARRAKQRAMQLGGPVRIVSRNVEFGRGPGPCALAL